MNNYLFNVIVIWCLLLSCEKNNNNALNYTYPEIYIDSISSLNNSSVRVYINLENTGGGQELQNAICYYSISGSQTLNDAVTTPTISKSLGNSFFDITNLQPASSYTLKLSCTNYGGIKKDVESNFTTSPPEIGQTLFGAKVAYILQPGDVGYDPNSPHGFVVSPTLATNKNWGCSGINVGSTSLLIGDGINNSLQMYGSGCMGWNSTGNALFYCYTYQGNNPFTTQSQWYLPSAGELLKIYENRSLIGYPIGATSSMNFWSSSEFNSNEAWVVNLALGSQYYMTKNAPVNQTNVIAIRYF